MSSKHQMRDRDLVSTIIPVYNRPVVLRDAVQSVLDQTYRPIEIILVDDESTDSTPQTIKELVDRCPDIIRATRQANGGPGVARETGRQMARGEFIQYLDSDDILLPQKFDKQVAALQARPDTGVAYCKTYEGEIGKPFSDPPSARTGEYFDELFPHLLNGRIWQTSTPLIRKSLSDQVGPWTDQRQEEDWEYDSRIASLRTKLVWVEDYLCAHRHHEGERAGGNSLGNPTKMRWRYQTQTLLYERSVAYGVQAGSIEMEAYSRSLFLLCRQCGAAGLVSESQELFNLARKAAGPKRASGEMRSVGVDFKLYGYLASLIGWVNAGRIAVALDHIRAR